MPPFLQGTSVVPGGGMGSIMPVPPTDPWEAAEPHYQGVLRISMKFPPFDLSYWLGTGAT